MGFQRVCPRLKVSEREGREIKTKKEREERERERGREKGEKEREGEREVGVEWKV